MTERMEMLEAVAMALLRHIEGDDVTRDLITDDEWAGYLSDADYVSGLISAAGYAVVPKQPTNRMCAAGGPEVRKACGLDEGPGNMHTIWAAMLAASEPQP